MNPTFQKATKQQVKLRMALDGPSGSGKTYTALIAAKALSNGGKVAVIDTERGSASLYADLFSFDVLELSEFNPQHYIDGIKAAEEAGYAVIVIDSLSHAWEGEGGALDMVEDARKRQRTDNSFTAWRDVTPVHRHLVDAMLQSKCHIVATMRSKMEYVQEKNSDGKTVIRKVGLAPIQRAGMEYEFTIVGDLDLDHNLVISKSRMASLADAVEKKPGEKFFKQILDWLNSGAVPAPAPATSKATFSPPAAAGHGSNGNGNTDNHKFMTALQLKTPKGTPLSDLTDEQMVTVQLKANGDIQTAAGYLLGVAIPEDYDNYFSLVTVAEDKKVAIDPLPEKCTRIQLWREMQKLIEVTK